MGGSILLCTGGLVEILAASRLQSALLFIQPDPSPACSNGHSLIMEESTSPYTNLMTPHPYLLPCCYVLLHMHIYSICSPGMGNAGPSAGAWDPTVHARVNQCDELGRRI